MVSIHVKILQFYLLNIVLKSPLLSCKYFLPISKIKLDFRVNTLDQKTKMVISISNTYAAGSAPAYAAV